MKKYIAAIMIVLVLPVAAHAELAPADLELFSLNLSAIISFFAGCLAIMAFIMGVNGGKFS